MTIQTTTSPDGEVLVTMTAQEYQDLIDARDSAIIMRDVRAGAHPTIPSGDVPAYLAAPTPLAFWRKHRGMTQVELAEKAQVGQSYIAQLESGQKTSADIRIYARMAAALNVRIEDLLAD